MRFQFSLATLLVCLTALAVVCAFCIAIPVNGEELISDADPFGLDVLVPFNRPPKLADIALRLALWGPLSITATLGVIWIVRQKSGREN